MARDLKKRREIRKCTVLGQVMKLYMNKLTPYEHHEIFNYPQIYFIGANAKKRPGIIGGPNNCGYDDDQVS